jgi:hypothetical protein
VRRKFVLWGLTMAFLSSGCRPTHLVYVHNASLGIDVSVSTEGTGRLVFGYDRDTFALVPRKDESTSAEAMSLVAVSCVYADGLNEVQFDHFIATGETANNVAMDDDGLQAIRKAIYGEKGQKGAPQCRDTSQSQ